MQPERKKETHHPVVKAEKSFKDIIDNFTDPREVLREAISNAFDWGASNIKISVYEDANRADRELVIDIWDNGLGLNKERFLAFWNLSDSPGLKKDKYGRKVGGRVGEKGYGTKTYWKCRKIEVESIAKEDDGSDWHVLGEIIEPINILVQEDRVPDCEYAWEPAHGQDTYTEVTIRGYHTRSKEEFRHETLKDYIQWFTKFGAIELEIGINTNEGKSLELQGLGCSEPETITFGHTFPSICNNIKRLQNQYQDTWPHYYVNKWVFPSVPIEGYPSNNIDIVFYIEGDSAKRQHNPMLGRSGRIRERWHYTVADRYGLYPCRDWIPLGPSQRLNEWISEKSEWTLYHAFVNCQDFAITANRGSIGNTDRDLLNQIQVTVQKVFKTQIKPSQEFKLYEDEIEFTKQRSTAERTEKDEESDLEKRHYNAKKKRCVKYQPPKRPAAVLLEPRQEAEVLILFSMIAALRPDLFEFEIVDYSTSRGIDALCLLKTGSGGLDKGNLRYIEFKRALTHEFKDHTFSRLAGIVCWECNLENGAVIRDLAGQERTLSIAKGTGDNTIYMLLAPPELATNNIKVYVLKEYLKEKLGLTFKTHLR